MTTITQPVGFQFSLTPASVRLGTGITHYNGHVTVIDDGSVAITVKMEPWGLTHCATLSGTPSWLHVSEHPFTLAAGASRTVGYTVSAPAGTNGSAAVLATAAPLHAKGHGAEAGKLSGAVGSRVTVGTGTTVCHAAVATPVASNSGLGAAWLALPLAVLGIGAVVALVTRRRRRNRTAI